VFDPLKQTKVRRILVPIDFSDESINTLRVAKLLAARFRAQLDLVHVIPPSPPTLPPHRAMFPDIPSAGTTARTTLSERRESMTQGTTVKPTARVFEFADYAWSNAMRGRQVSRCRIHNARSLQHRSEFLRLDC
jgi:nucleotide-binding universal stress UspA family protein